MSSAIRDPRIFGLEPPAFPARRAAVLRACSAYGRGYVALLADPFGLLIGQLCAFFGLSVYVKLVEMCQTTEYGVAWLGSGRLFTNCLHALLFCAQEMALFTALLAAVLVWRYRRRVPGGRQRAVIWVLAFIVFPALSAIEVLEIAHFKLFLAPLGPEELRLVSWTGQIVTAGNVFGVPEVAVGLLAIAAWYYLAPPALWLPQMRGRGGVLLMGFLAVTSTATGLAPKPLLTEALLTPHPLLWLVIGNRTDPAWASGESSPMPSERAVRRYTVKERPTNVLIFVLESTRAASTAMYNPEATAGRDLLRLRDEMVVFDNVYAPVPTSAHAIFSILYGVYPYLGPFWTSTGASVAADSMAQVFGRAGYLTQFFITGDLSYDNIHSFAARGFDRVLDINNWPGQEGYALLPWGRDDRLLIEEIKRFIAANPKLPFFVFAMTSNPHHPYAADQLPALRHAGVLPAAARAAAGAPETDTGDKAAYERLVDYDLRLLAELYNWMKRKGVAERTLLLVLGDHGEAFGEHPGNFGHATFIYEENVHIPCFILHPRRLGLPRHITQLGSEVDLRATILDIVGRRDSEDGSGMSLLKEDRGRTVANFTENGVSRFGLRDARYTYIYTPHAETEQMFERSHDRRETRDVSRRDPLVTERYRVHLQRWEMEHQRLLDKILQ